MEEPINEVGELTRVAFPFNFFRLQLDLMKNNVLALLNDVLKSFSFIEVKFVGPLTLDHLVRDNTHSEKVRLEAIVAPVHNLRGQVPRCSGVEESDFLLELPFNVLLETP